MKGTCRTCKHWQDIYAMHPKPMTVGGCALTLAESSADPRRMREPRHPESMAHAMWVFPENEEFVRVMLETQPDFGCTQWEEGAS